MIAIGDATLIWITPLVLRLYYKINGPENYSGMGLIDINSRNAVQAKSWPGSSGVIRETRRRHAGSHNLAFCDGHVETSKESRLFEETDTALRRWNTDNEPHPDRLTKN